MEIFRPNSVVERGCDPHACNDERRDLSQRARNARNPCLRRAGDGLLSKDRSVGPDRIPGIGPPPRRRIASRDRLDVIAFWDPIRFALASPFGRGRRAKRAPGEGPALRRASHTLA